MKSRTKKKSEPSTWRDLLPNSSRRPASKTAMRKRSLSFAKSTLVVICLGMVGVGFWWGSQRDVYETVLLWNKMDEPVKRVTFESDGVLDHRWFQNWFGPLRDRTLMQIDIDDLHSELIKEPQIAYAQVRRIFPSTLEVKILEENPVLVVRLGKKGGGVQDWMISADGDLYQGVGYTRQILSLLPSLSISPKQLQIDPNGRGYRKLEGISFVTPLLELARREYPSIYRDWKVVSYSDPQGSGPGSFVKVNSGKVKNIRFSPGNYAAQMKRLKYLLLEPDFRRQPIIESIDLSHNRSVFAKL